MDPPSPPFPLPPLVRPSGRSGSHRVVAAIPHGRQQPAGRSRSSQQAAHAAVSRPHTQQPAGRTRSSQQAPVETAGGLAFLLLVRALSLRRRISQGGLRTLFAGFPVPNTVPCSAWHFGGSSLRTQLNIPHCTSGEPQQCWHV